MKQNIEASAAKGIPSLVQFAEDLRLYSDREKYYDNKEKEIRKYLNSLKQFRKKLLDQVRKKGIDIAGLRKNDRKLIKGIIKKSRRKHKEIDINRGLCVLDRVPPKSANSIDEIEAAIQHLEEQLAKTGADSEFANIDLRNAMQKGEMMLKMMSNLSKEIHDTAMAVIRDIK